MWVPLKALNKIKNADINIKATKLFRVFCLEFFSFNSFFHDPDVIV